jgi:N-acetylmuramic acid 6-phosphate etherase
MSTESPSTEHTALDTYTAQQLVQALVLDQSSAAQAVARAGGQLVAVIDAAVPRLAAGGRLIYVGAGTSGRLGVLDATELNPTFSWPVERALGIIAGGLPALTSAVEGAEDDAAKGAADIKALSPTAQDVVFLLSAAGNAAYVLAACAVARQAGALTVGITNNEGSALHRAAELPVLLLTGPELISGSTRLKAGTAQKIALNTLSSAIMVRLGKVYGNLMVDLRATNSKLQARALKLTMLASGADEANARSALEQAGGQVKTAILMLRSGCDAPSARARLAACNGFLRKALEA